MVLVIDNYDSFTYNLVQYLGELGRGRAGDAQRRRVRSRMSSPRGADRIVISPGPGRPEAGGRDDGRDSPARRDDADSRRLPRPSGDRRGVRRRGRARGRADARQDVDDRARRPGVFSGIAGPFVASRYHSLVVAERGLPAELEITARTREDTHDHGASPPHVAGPRRPVSSRVDSDRRGQTHPPELPGRQCPALAGPCTPCSKSCIEKLTRHEDLTTDEAAAAMAEVMEGRAAPAHIAGC